MADVKLGPEGSETTLPTLRWMGRDKPNLPVDSKKQISLKRMSDGSIRAAMYQIKRTFSLYWGYVSFADLSVLKDLNVLNQTLRFQDNNEDDTWHNVVIAGFRHEPVDTSIRSLGYYKCSMTLKEL